MTKTEIIDGLAFTATIIVIIAVYCVAGAV